ncbi:deoxyguanosinetriphosphate triphosphohydrolase [Hydrogenophaga crassostreae]|uniref:Deoxyguanosinetriphosphate triphosphohydrolase-like protein n=1 Tax=Hydrogenophaga crassostreae TaxID=1763535 RepID=A0A167HHF0_9BURK|nr:deoxyguanosinetriphosphate triphosphohydrolase [Hydrogenophaga crassostreae]AOW15375.1 deoxyguanosinetriphosphate triphosphohydrolase [Hydrogenophaga crassostreae]OAD41204.1 deoxyguanosinetriphosphate triphosphohydrolase [Hydrogenophaga crassostreae]
MPVPHLASYACLADQSRGRAIPEADAPTRSVYQRDRDRIVHSSAFRRLVYKTQVFLNHEGDLFRTRLTHSLEVAQLARSIARTLGLNEDLVEAIALAHDLGHTPFGHAGQDALNGCLKALGPQGDDPAKAVVVGFEHNLQSLRVVDRLEERYPSFDGLNLTFETREGILKHCSRADAERLALVDGTGVAQRFLDGGSPSLEAQLCNLADEIAYNAHDIDDGVRSGLLTLEQMAEVPLFERFRQQALQAHPQLAGRRLLFESIRLMLSQQVYDVIDTTRERIAASGVQSVDDVRRSKPMVAFSDTMRAESTELKRFLFRNLYRHPQVTETTERAAVVVRDLFAFLMAHPEEIGEERASTSSLPRVVADYIAGMTDRFAIREHERLCGTVLFP